MNFRNILAIVFPAMLTFPVMAQENNHRSEVLGDDFTRQTIDVGAGKVFTLSESTSAASVIRNEDFIHRSGENIEQSMKGHGVGLLSRNIRGLQSLSGSSAMLLVDGVQRGISDLSADEVESVTILKDAAALALYGHEAANGAILITTKRGKSNSRHVKVSFDHVYNFLSNKPKFVDAYTYANAMNEARLNEGITNPFYTADEVAAFQSGKYPYYYPNVDWVNETFRNHGVTNKYTAEFYGGMAKFRYYTIVNLLTDKGFINNPNTNDGYSTQDKYVRGNLRTNLDIELTSTTHLKANIAGILSEQSQPGDEANLWSMVYSIPSLAFPVKDEKGLWGGSSQWSGTKNPVAQAQGAGYYKSHKRGLYSDITLNQDLSSLLPGLGANARVVYDNASILYENHSKTYKYGMSTVGWIDGAVDESTLNRYEAGTDGTLGSDAKTKTMNRRFQFDGGFDFNRSFGKHDVYSQIKWQYQFTDSESTNSTLYRQYASWWTHYGFNKKYYVDLALVASASSRLAPGDKWAFSPTVSLAWVLSNEQFMQNVSWVNFLKLRASAGILQLDLLPGDSEWFYYEQSYSLGHGNYAYDSNYGGGSSTFIGRMPTENPSHEKAYKYNFGVDSRLFNGLDVVLDAYYQQRKNIWVESSGKYSSLVGLDVPYVNQGRVDSWGLELGLNYEKKVGDVLLNVGARMAYNRNEIKNQAEEPRLYSNLVQTGNQLSQLYGLKAMGLFTQDEIDRMKLPMDNPDYVPVQSFGTVRPGDIRYEDVNGDKKIDANDKVALGFATTPQMHYAFNLGAEWKGLGIYALFQGTARYSGTLNTSGMYWPLLGKTSLSQYAYDNRWTPENPNAALPRLSTVSNKNNYQSSSWWIVDRSYFKLRNVEVYYHLPEKLLEKTKCIHAAKVYVRGNDLFCKDHIPVGDAEGYGASEPVTRSVAMGLQLTF